MADENDRALPVPATDGTASAALGDEPIPATAHLTILACAVAVVAFGLWASTAKLDIVSAAAGEVTPASQVKTVQHLEGGIVRGILVKEGSPVREGQPLVELESTVSGAEVGELRIRLASLAADIARLEALEKGLPGPAFPDGFVEANREIARNAQNRFDSQRKRFDSDVKRQRELIMQREEESREIGSRIESGRETLKLVREQIAISEGLLKNNLTNRFDHLGLLKEGQRLEGGIAVDTAALARTRAASAEARAELERMRSIFDEDTRKALDEGRLNRAEIAQRIGKFEDSLKRTVVRSPVDGIVKTLKVVTVGGVLRPGDSVADIVPAGDHLIIEAKLPTPDIGHVTKGQAATVKLASADAIRFGNLTGTVIDVSPDALLTPDGKPFYRVRIDTGKDHFERDGLRYDLFPGMQVIASIRTGERTVLRYIFDPIRYD